MATATRPKTRRQTVSLREDARARPQSVDAQAGVIRGVKVLGLVSDNGRKYLPEAIRKAAPLYEGMAVNVDHPARPRDSRSSEDRIGWLEAVRVEPDGLYADLHLLVSHPLTPRVLEAAQKRPELFGLSHNAEGKGEHQGGVFVVAEIAAVSSVDLVADPATNRSLFEGRTVTKTLKELIGASALQPAARVALVTLAEAVTCKPTAEDEMPMADAPVEDAGPADGRALLAQAVGALVQSSDEGDHDLASKIMKLLKPESVEPAEEADDEEGDEGDDEEKPKEEGKKPKRPARGAKGLTEARAKALCKLAGIDATAEVLEAVKGIDEDKAVAVLQLAKGKAPAAGGGKAPRSIDRQQVSEGKTPTAKNAGEFAASIKG